MTEWALCRASLALCGGRAFVRRHINLRSGGSSFCTVLPQVDPQSGHTYSYLSPSGRIRSRRLRTFTARLHLGQASRLASKRSNAGRPFCAITSNSPDKSCHQWRLSATFPSASIGLAPTPPHAMRALLCVVKNDAEAEALTGLQPTDTVADVDAIMAARAAHRAPSR